ncbi:plant UBX domain-containing protein 11 isoform X2 [Amborella trichopoda]|uniref:plant UBX domain-containing protein 11 isoform X2 n=1 Tax=Amborella trichopoda TaxID=13333 RepID=UPI0005D3EFF2|nr:plant UBX domain-containing protein 11 isoform X2 [Amborella trichopoda]|eukprot:XP_011628666.1 plant UBX domain-containing protein 11 isoform X2 [Amborella trichopoda]
MESSASLLAFKGSVPEAINETRSQQKILLVYISGTDEASWSLEQSTWMDLDASVSKHCIFLHLREGSLDEKQFSVCYPQKSVPNISAVGYNGILLWQHDGYASPETLVAGIQKAWDDFHFRETAAAIMTAALLSNNPQSSSSDASSVGHGESSIPAKPSSSPTNKESERKPSDASLLEPKSNYREPTPKLEESELSIGTAAEGTHFPQSEGESVEQKSPSSEDTKSSLIPETADVSCSTVDVRSFDIYGGSHAQQKNVSLDDMHSTSTEEVEGFPAFEYVVPQENTQTVANAPEIDHCTFDAKVDDRSSLTKLSDVHLHIRFPDGKSIKEKFEETDTLGMVREYINDNRTSQIGPYSLAVPYPRKIFSESEMSKTLLELGMGSREALIIIPRNPSVEPRRGQTSSQANAAGNSQDPSHESSPGLIWRMLSYLNPFSYVGGGGITNSSDHQQQASLSNAWQYRPNANLRSSLAGSERSDAMYRSQTSAGERVVSSGKAATKRWGGNIHTLNHDENDDASRDRNTFWNGNSTQFGGDNNK